jgi:opacity protein-like surface antigen
MRTLTAIGLVAAGWLAAGRTGAAEPDAVFQPVSLRRAADAGPRLYAAGILGASFAMLDVEDFSSVKDPLFTSGGALGIEFARPWRLEVEGRARDPIADVQTGSDTTTALAASGGWSAMVNLWRDVEVTDRLGLYVGGGIGGGGYRFKLAGESPPPFDITLDAAEVVNSFAWQAGGGLAYALTDRITLDLGYRFFALTGGSVNVTQSLSGAVFDTFPLQTDFSANELFFAIRIYEPFRMFRR